jgi:pyruvate,water dikinase
MILKGIPGSKGVAEGPIYIADEKNLAEFKEGSILIAERTSPNLVPIMLKSRGVVTERGGSLSHAAIFCREMGLPCVVGVTNLIDSLSGSKKVKIDGEIGTVVITE